MGSSLNLFLVKLSLIAFSDEIQNASDLPSFDRRVGLTEFVAEIFTVTKSSRVCQITGRNNNTEGLHSPVRRYKGRGWEGVVEKY